MHFGLFCDTTRIASTVLKEQVCTEKMDITTIVGGNIEQISHI